MENTNNKHLKAYQILDMFCAGAPHFNVSVHLLFDILWRPRPLPPSHTSNVLARAHSA